MNNGRLPLYIAEVNGLKRYSGSVIMIIDHLEDTEEKSSETSIPALFDTFLNVYQYLIPTHCRKKYGYHKKGPGNKFE